MSEAYKVSIELELEDKATKELKGIVGMLDKAGEALTELGSGLKKLPELGKSLAENLNDAAKAATALGDNPGLKTAVASFDKMAAASADIAKNLSAAQRAGESMSSVSHRGGGKHTYKSAKSANPSSDSEAESAHGSIIHSARESKHDEIGIKAIAKKFSASLAKELGAKIAEVAANALVDGVKKNADLEDVNKKIVSSSDIAPGQWDQRMQQLKTLEQGTLTKYSTLFHGSTQEVAITRQKFSEMLPEKTAEEQDEIFKRSMPIVDYYAKRSGKSADEVSESLLNLGANGNAANAEEYSRFTGAGSLVARAMGANITDVSDSSEPFKRALQHAGKDGENIQDFLMLTATMKKAGVANEDNADLVYDMGDDALSEKLGGKSPEDKRRAKAGEDLGLYHDGKATFYKNGKVDQELEFSLIAKALADAKGDKQKKSEVYENVRAAFAGKGEQGDRLVELLQNMADSDVGALAGMHAKLDEAKKDPNFIEKAASHETTNEKMDKVNGNWDRFKINAAGAVTGVVNATVDKLDDVTGSLADAAEKHPVAAETSLVAATAAGSVYKAKKAGNLVNAVRKIFSASKDGEIASAASKGGKVADAASKVVRVASGATEGVEAVGVTTEVLGGAATVTEGAAAATVGAEAIGVAGIGVEAGAVAGAGALEALAMGGTALLGPIGLAALAIGGLGYAAYRLTRDTKETAKNIPPASSGEQVTPSISPEDARKSATLPPPSQYSMQPGAADPGKDSTQEILDKVNREIDNAKKDINVTIYNYLDGKEIASHMVAPNSQGPSGFNIAASRLTSNSNLIGSY